MNIALSILATLLIIFVVPIFVYGLFAKFARLKEPDKKLSFLVSVLVQKLGTAGGFVALYVISADHFNGNWLLYAAVWAAMFAVVEIGQAIGPNYSKKEAAAGVISELIYFPLAGFVVAALVG